MKLKGRRVLVTGADGFIGSHLVEGLLACGAKVRAFVYYNSFNSCGWLDTFDKKIYSQIDIFSGDIRDPHGVHKAMEGIDCVFHLAALIGIPFSYHSPDSYVDTNIKGTLNILQAARALGTKRILVTSTSEVYGTAQYIPIDEKHPLQAQSPYSATKIAADKLAESFYRSFGLPVIIVRPFNTYGPRQSARAIIPTIITQLLAGKKQIHIGSSTPKRDFNYVKDVVRAYIDIAQTKSLEGDVINISSGKEISIGEISQILINMLNPSAKIVSEKKRIRPANSEVERLLGDNTKIKLLTSWKPIYTLKEGLAETIKWFKTNYNKYKSDEYNI